jgi:hypothetical protein
VTTMNGHGFTCVAIDRISKSLIYRVHVPLTVQSSRAEESHPHHRVARSGCPLPAPTERSMVEIRWHLRGL